MIKDERELDGAVHGEFLRKAFRKSGGESYRTRIGFNTFVKEATRRVCMKSKNSLLYFHAIQGPTGGDFESA